MPIKPSLDRHGLVTWGLCFLAALLEGLDIQSAGIAGPGMRQEFGFSVAQMGLIFSASIAGLLPGAAACGRLADRVGRKRVLIVSVLTFAVATLLTASATGFGSMLVLRFLAGVGLGGALPLLIALVAEAVPAQIRNTAVTTVYCGVPFGGAVAAAIGMSNTASEWRLVFYVGGFAPLVLLPFLALFLPESRQFLAKTGNAMRGGGTGSPHSPSRQPSLAEALFARPRALTTVLLWLSFLFTLVVVYLLVNWLPTLLLTKGLTRADTGLVQILFNVGGGIGCAGLGVMMDRWHPRAAVAIVYVGIVASLTGLAYSNGFTATLVAGFAAGMCAIGAQALIYALAPSFYPAEVRGTGVGMAVAVGRVGSVAGPFLGGLLLAGGQSPALVIAAAIPGVVVAALCAITLVSKSRVQDETATFSEPAPSLAA